MNPLTGLRFEVVDRNIRWLPEPTGVDIAGFVSSSTTGRPFCALQDARSLVLPSVTKSALSGQWAKRAKQSSDRAGCVMAIALHGRVANQCSGYGVDVLASSLKCARNHHFFQDRSVAPNSAGRSWPFLVDWLKQAWLSQEVIVICRERRVHHCGTQIRIAPRFILSCWLMGLNLCFVRLRSGSTGRLAEDTAQWQGDGTC